MAFEQMTTEELAGAFDDLSNPTAPEPDRFLELEALEAAADGAEDKLAKVQELVQGMEQAVASVNQNYKTDIYNAKVREVRELFEQSIEQATAELSRAAATCEAQRKYWSPAQVLMRAEMPSQDRAVWQTRLARCSGGRLSQWAGFAVGTRDTALAGIVLEEIEIRADLAELHALAIPRGERRVLLDSLTWLGKPDADRADAAIRRAQVARERVKVITGDRRGRAHSSIAAGLRATM